VEAEVTDNVGLFLRKRAFQTPDRVAYIDAHSGRRLTFRQLSERSDRVANYLLAQGVRPQDRVAVLMRNCPEFLQIYYAIAAIGAIMVPLNWRLVTDEIRYILDHSGATWLIYQDEFLDSVEPLHAGAGAVGVRHWLQLGSRRPRAPFAGDFDEVVDDAAQETPPVAQGGNDALLIMYTSGTTGRPKGVVHTHQSAIWATLNLDASSSFRDGDKYLTPMPMFHTGGLTPLSVNVYRGITSCVVADFDAELVWRLIETEGITTGFLVPTMLQFMLGVDRYQKRFDCSSLRWVMSGGAPVTHELARPFADLGIRILQAYGLTETCGMTSIMDLETAAEKPESIGRETFHVEVRIVDDRNEICAPGEPGELIARGKPVFREYWNNAEATRETLRDGWLHTGDLAVMDDAGYVFVRDRLKNMILSGGENIYPAEIERTLLEHPKIAEVAVIGQKSPRWGESPAAIIVPRDRSLTEDEVLNFCRAKLAGYKRPKRVEFVDALPRNALGKVVKFVLKQQFPQEAPE